MKVVTFNIRCDYGQDGENNFCFRRPLILEKLRRERPDLICFQEVLPHVATWLKEELADYYVIGCGRSETLEDEQMTVAYRKDRLNLIQMETFWLSDTPNVPGSRYPRQSICPRTAAEALFEDLSGKTVFRLVNTHLDHEYPEARAQGLSQILQKLSQSRLFPDAPTERGVKHLRELMACRAAGFEAAVCVVVQMSGMTAFSPNDRTHPEFGAALREAAQAGVKVLAVECAAAPGSLTMTKPIPVKL